LVKVSTITRHCLPAYIGEYGMRLLLVATFILGILPWGSGAALEVYDRDKAFIEFFKVKDKKTKAKLSGIAKGLEEVAA